MKNNEGADLNKKIFNLMLISSMFIFSNSIAAEVERTADVHSHIITPQYLQILAKHNALNEETFPLPEWNIKNQLQFMEMANIKYSIISMPAPHPCYDDSEECKKIIRDINIASSEIKNQYPDKFKFLASLPLPDVESAIEEAKYALDVLGADGIKLSTNSRGQYIGDKELDSLMEILNDRNAVVFIHPCRPAAYSKNIIDTTPLPLFEYPAETTRTVMNILSRNLLAKYPNIKMIVPHAGSFLPLAIPRFRSIYPVVHQKGLIGEVDIDKNLKNIYYDLAGNPTSEVIKELLTITTPEHIMYGSDFPYLSNNVLNKNLLSLKQEIEKDKELEKYSQDFLYKNADKLFNYERNVK